MRDLTLGWEPKWTKNPKTASRIKFVLQYALCGISNTLNGSSSQVYITNGLHGLFTVLACHDDKETTTIYALQLDTIQN